MQSEAKAKALEQFTEYFVKNYPGPDTVIFDPKWHAPKIFAAAYSAITAALSEKRAAEVAIKPLEWRLEDERDPDFPRWNAEWNGMVFSVFKVWWGKENKWGFVGGDCGFHHTEDEAKAAAQADYEQRIRSALVDVPVEPVATYFARQIEWSLETFGPSLRTKGVIDHIRKELAEIEREPHDLSEWIDVVILAMDGFWRHGGKADELMPALLTKQQKNMARVWPDWRTMSEDRAIEHDRSHDALPPLPHRGEDSAEVERLRDLLSRAEEYVIDGVTNAKAEAEMNAPYPARAHRYDAALAEVRQLYADIQGALAATRSGSATGTSGKDF